MSLFRGHFLNQCGLSVAKHTPVSPVVVFFRCRREHTCLRPTSSTRRWWWPGKCTTCVSWDPSSTACATGRTRTAWAVVSPTDVSRDTDGGIASPCTAAGLQWNESIESVLAVENQSASFFSGEKSRWKRCLHFTSPSVTTHSFARVCSDTHCWIVASKAGLSLSVVAPCVHMMP